MAGVGSSSISFSGLRTAWGNSSYLGGSDPGSSNISISEFRGQNLQMGLIPDLVRYQLILILKVKHLVHQVSFVTNDFNFNDDFSGESDRLYPEHHFIYNKTNQLKHKFKIIHSNVTVIQVFYYVHKVEIFN